jgi:hypothetical protein
VRREDGSGRFSGMFRSVVVRLGECQLRLVNILSLDLNGRSSRTWIIARMMREQTNSTSLGGLVR